MYNWIAVLVLLWKFREGHHGYVTCLSVNNCSAQKSWDFNEIQLKMHEDMDIIVGQGKCHIWLFITFQEKVQNDTFLRLSLGSASLMCWSPCWCGESLHILLPLIDEDVHWDFWPNMCWIDISRNNFRPTFADMIFSRYLFRPKSHLTILSFADTSKIECFADTIFSGGFGYFRVDLTKTVLSNCLAGPKIVGMQISKRPKVKINTFSHTDEGKKNAGYFVGYVNWTFFCGHFGWKLVTM